MIGTPGCAPSVRTISAALAPGLPVISYSYVFFTMIGVRLMVYSVPLRVMVVVLVAVIVPMICSRGLAGGVADMQSMPDLCKAVKTFFARNVKSPRTLPRLAVRGLNAGSVVNVRRSD